MPESKKPDQKPHKRPLRTRKSSHDTDISVSHRKGFGREFLISIAAHIVAPLALAAASTAWLYFAQNQSGSIPPWQFFVFVVLTIAFTYLSLISLQFFFHNHFKLARHLSLHVALLAILIVTVTAPLALMLTFTTARTNELLADVQKAKDELASERKAREDADNDRIQLYKLVNDRMPKLLSEQSIETKDFQDLLNICIQSIALNHPQVHDLRATIAYIDETGKYLGVPEKGYYGVGFDESMKDLFFDVSPETVGKSDDDSRKRVGVAGWSYFNKIPVRDDDVQQPKANVGYLYKPFQGSDKDKQDRAMICVLIPKPGDGTTTAEAQYIGVLSISSMTPVVFEKKDIAVASFFATLLGKFKTPIKTPAAAQKMESAVH